MSYDRTIRLDADFDTAVTAVRKALADQGFGILTEIDVKATLKAKLGHDMEDYLILGACNPPLAHQALEADRSIGSLFRCSSARPCCGREEGAARADPGRPRPGPTVAPGGLLVRCHGRRKVPAKWRWLSPAGPFGCCFGFGAEV
ncbi:DUF302 domain-containing protein [Streptomyces aureus]|uniref:DUF302 domain-containing protein n=1 Tax=Streptomyces aureus TaxID=193461 RepID=UPI0031D48F7A